MYFVALLSIFIVFITTGVNSWHVLSPLQGKVLGGNYGQTGLDFIPDLRTMRKVMTDDDEKEVPADGANVKATIADVQKAYSTNFKNVIMKAINISKMEESSDMQSDVNSCEENLTKSCLYLVPEYCRRIYVRCLAKKNKLFAALTKVIVESLGLLCKHLKTKYMQMFESPKGGFPHLQTYSAFLGFLQAAPRDYPTIIPQLANAMMPIIIRHTLTPLLPLKGMLTAMEKEMMVQQPGTLNFRQNNPGCLTLQMSASVETMMDLFYKDSALTDVLLPGFAFSNIVSKYMSGDTFGMTVLTETYRMFTGTATGFACNYDESDYDSEENNGHGDDFGNGGYIGGGYRRKKRSYASSSSQKGNCDEFGKNPQSGFPIPEKLLPEKMDISGLVNPSCNSKPGGDLGKPQIVEPSTDIGGEPQIEEPSTDIGGEPQIDEPSTDIGGEPQIDEPSTDIGGKPQILEPITDIGGEPQIEEPRTDIGGKPQIVEPSTDIGGEPQIEEPKEDVGGEIQVEEPKDEAAAEEEIQPPTEPLVSETAEGEEGAARKKRKSSAV